PEGADDELDALGNRRREQISEPKVDEIRDARHLRPFPADLEHAGRRVDADHADALGGDRHRNSTGADTQLDDRRRHAARLGDVEADVLGDAYAPGVVKARDRVVRVHAVMLSTVTASALTL